MEIISSSGIDRVLGAGHELKAHQIGVDSGRLDLLTLRPDVVLMVIEINKNQLAKSHAEQWYSCSIPVERCEQ